MSGFKKPDLAERQNTAAQARKAALEKFRASAADPAVAERQTARMASADIRRTARSVREIEKAEKKALDAERAQQAQRDSEQAAAESVNREATVQAERKAARDARYAARKSRSKR
jgi:hypothetical protein